MAVADTPLMMAGEDLDSTVIRKLDELREAMSKKPSLPPWLIPLLMWSIIQLVGSIWWAATISAKLDALLAAETETKQRVSVLEMRVNNSDATFGEKVRSKVRETIDDLDLIRVHRKDD